MTSPIITVKAGVPSGPMKLAEWIEWRKAEDERMVAEFTAKVVEYLRQHHDAQIEKICHDLDGGSTH
jgi:hypothetical protein